MKRGNKVFKKLVIGTMIALLLTGSMPNLMPLGQNVSIVEAASVKLSSSKLTLLKGESKTLKLNGGSSKVTWSTGNKSVALVNSKGKVTAKKKGTAVITAKSKGKKYTCKVSVEEPKLNQKNVTISKGKSVVLKLSGTKQKAKWSSSSKSVASVQSNGKVTGIKKGSTTITAQVGKLKLKCKVTVLGNGGSLQGTILNSKGAADKGSRLILIPQNGKAKAAVLGKAADWQTANSGGLIKYGIFGTTTDYRGGYAFKGLPAGDYTCVIISNEIDGNKNVDDYDEFTSYFEDILNGKSVNLLKEFMRGYVFSIYSDTEIKDDRVETLDEDFSDYVDDEDDNEDDEDSDDGSDDDGEDDGSDTDEDYIEEE